MRVTLCSRVCLCAALLAVCLTVDAASRKSTQEVIDNIHAPGTTGTPASNFTADTNYTAIINTISTTLLKSRFTTAIFAALPYLHSMPSVYLACMAHKAPWSLVHHVQVMQVP